MKFDIHHIVHFTRIRYDKRIGRNTVRAHYEHDGGNRFMILKDGYLFTIFLSSVVYFVLFLY